MKLSHKMRKVLVLAAAVLVVWFVYEGGYRQGMKNNQQDIQFNLPWVHKK